MTRKQMRALRRKVKIGLVVGAAAYLSVGIIGLAIDEDEVDALENDKPQMVSVDENKAMETENEEKVITYTYNVLDAYESYLLAKIAMAEAGTQDTEGKALVMLVVLNRAWGINEFPNTVEDVIYDEGQFSPVGEGKFESIVPNEDCWAALEMVMQGWDESCGALYFESKSSSEWHKNNLKFLFQHQDHYFYAEKE